MYLVDNFTNKRNYIKLWWNVMYTDNELLFKSILNISYGYFDILFVTPSEYSSNGTIRYTIDCGK